MKRDWLQFIEPQAAVLILRLYHVEVTESREFCRILITVLLQMLFQKALNLLGLAISPHFNWLFLPRPVLLLGQVRH